MFVLKSLTATWLGKDISIIPVPLRENACRFVMKWKLGVLLDKNKENSDRTLLRFFLQGHLGANKNVALDVDKLVPITLERVEKIRSLSVIKKRAERRWRGMACTSHYTSQTWSGYEVLQRWFLALIQMSPHWWSPLLSWKNCWSHESCVLYHGRWYNAPDFWCSTWKGICVKLVLSARHLFFDQKLSFPGHRPTADYGSSRYRSGDLVAYQGLFPDKEDPCRMLQADGWLRWRTNPRK